MRKMVMAALLALVLAFAVGCGSQDVLTPQEKEGIVPSYTKLAALCHQERGLTQELETLSSIYGEARTEAEISPYPFIEHRAEDLRRRHLKIAAEQKSVMQRYDAFYPYSSSENSRFQKYIEPAFEKVGLPVSLDPQTTEVLFNELDCP